MTRMFAALLRNDRAATAIEYGFLITLISLAIYTSLAMLGEQKEISFNDIYEKFRNAVEQTNAG